jgi:AcrR family transcriptional regulator
VLGAAVDLCREVGYAKVSIEAIAALAGVGKQTIYRWWPSKAIVVLDAFIDALGDQVPYPDTDDVVADLQATLTQVARLGSDPERGPYFAALMGEAQADPDLRKALVDRFIRPRRDLVRQRLRRAQQSGDLSADLDIDVALDLLYGGIYHRLLLHNAPLTDRFVADTVALVITAHTSRPRGKATSSIPRRKAPPR